MSLSYAFLFYHNALSVPVWDHDDYFWNVSWPLPLLNTLSCNPVSCTCIACFDALQAHDASVSSDHWIFRHTWRIERHHESSWDAFSCYSAMEMCCHRSDKELSHRTSNAHTSREHSKLLFDGKLYHNIRMDIFAGCEPLEGGTGTESLYRTYYRRCHTQLHVWILCVSADGIAIPWQFCIHFYIFYRCVMLLRPNGSFSYAFEDMALSCRFCHRLHMVCWAEMNDWDWFIWFISKYSWLLVWLTFRCSKCIL